MTQLKNLNAHSLQGGYIIPAITEGFKKLGIEQWKIKAIHEKTASFHVHSSFRISETPGVNNPLLKVFHNQIMRGNPTFLHWDIEEKIALQLGHLKKQTHLGKLSHVFEGPESMLIKCWRSLHIIDPRISAEDIRSSGFAEKTESDAEAEFLFNHLPKAINSEFILQLIQPQRSVASMVDLPGHKHDFLLQRVDFAIELPIPEMESGPKGYCIEIDGEHHSDEIQEILDRKRDNAISGQWYEPIRFQTGEFGNDGFSERLGEFAEELSLHPPIINLLQNFEEPLYTTEEGLSAMQFTLTPFAIARIHLTLLHALMDGKLDFDASSWNIGVLERDVPCAYLAIKSFEEHFKHLINLEGNHKILPKINLSIWSTPEFSNSALHSNHEVSIFENGKHLPGAFDLFIDISILQRSEEWTVMPDVQSREYANIRSAYSASTPFLLFGKRINWQLGNYADDHSSSLSLKYVLRNLFRIIEFRPGQMQIFKKSLSNESVIGLLPTGGGKSLTYQFSALLQPGIVLVIDPIKSLMKDQVDSLSRMGITNSLYINSSLAPMEREIALQQMARGQALFNFISPERLQTEEFRQILYQMYRSQIYFTYGVIDEAHCVSEWGHDFRTSYLFLGKNLLKHCKAENGDIALFGLTATASYDVLADVQRELSGHKAESEISDDNIIRHETTNRDEIQYIIEQVEVPIKEKAMAERRAGKNFHWEPKKLVGVLKKEAIGRIIRNAPHLIKHFLTSPDSVVDKELLSLTYSESSPPATDQVMERISLNDDQINPFWSEDCRNAAIVFCPHKGWVFGVTGMFKNPPKRDGIYDYIETSFKNLKAGTFMGSSSDQDQVSQQDQEHHNIMNQEAFLDNELHIMVATKAFGMGIDKPNVRLAIHNTYPSSVESFVQESGRAGRDGKMALSIVLFNDQVFKSIDGQECEVDYDIQEFFHNQSFPGVREEKYALYDLLTGRIGVENKWLDKGIEGFLLQMEDDEESWIRLNFTGNKRKNKSDTDKALYRLSIIGVVEDVLVDYRGQTFKVLIRKRSDADYLRILRAYLNKFYPAIRVNEVIESIGMRKGETTIQRMLNFLIEFIYNEIAKKRYESISAMRECCRVGAQQGNIAMKAWIHTYFNSKYARSGYGLDLDDETISTYRSQDKLSIHTSDKSFNFSLYDWTEEGVEQHMDWVFDFIQLMKDDYNNSDIDNIKHLRGACTRMLISNPENFVFRLLRAYTAIVLGERLAFQAIRFDQIRTDIKTGFDQLLEYSETREVYFRSITRYLDMINHLLNARSDIRKEIIQIRDHVLFIQHVEWTEKFIEKII